MFLLCMEGITHILLDKLNKYTIVKETCEYQMVRAKTQVIGVEPDGGGNNPEALTCQSSHFQRRADH